MITLTLLHPLKSVPVQNWTFEPKPVIRIGRSIDNDVILYSAVVSRHHLEIRFIGSDWVLVNLGSNGTFVGGKRVNKARVEDGMIIRLANSGPKIRIRIDETELKSKLQTARRQQPAYLKHKDVSKDTIIN